MSQEQLYASFLLDRTQGVEIAIQADSVIEATRAKGTIKPLSAGAPFLEGIMQLRDEVIPVINLRKRLGLKNTSYDGEPTVAVVNLGRRRYGLLFDDIRDVLRVDKSSLIPIDPEILNEDNIISDLIKLNGGKRTMELLDLKCLFKDEEQGSTDTEEQSRQSGNQAKTYSRFVIFTAGDHEYGLPVRYAREITFLTQINDMFKSGILEGSLQLRGRTIPVMHAGGLLTGASSSSSDGENRRILVLSFDHLTFGLIVDQVREIMTVADQEILAVPYREEKILTGIHEREDGSNIMLIDVEHLVNNQTEILESMAQLSDEEEAEEAAEVTRSRHLITENCYLIFYVEKHFAIELKVIQEIIEPAAVMAVPGASGYKSEVINLRGRVVPVVDLRLFYGYPELTTRPGDRRLIICKDDSRLVALKVDSIVTIYKQEQYYLSPSLNPQLEARKDTLDRVIEFIGDHEKEHVLVVNVNHLLRNHLQNTETEVCPEENINTLEPSDQSIEPQDKGGNE